MIYQRAKLRLNKSQKLSMGDSSKARRCVLGESIPQSWFLVFLFTIQLFIQPAHNGADTKRTFMALALGKVFLVRFIPWQRFPNINYLVGFAPRSLHMSNVLIQCKCSISMSYRKVFVLD